MRPLGILGLLLTGCLLAGCGSDEGSASDVASASATPTSSATPSPSVSAPSAGAPTPATTTIVSETAAGGVVSTTGIELDSDAAVQDFGAQFTNPRLSDEVAQAAAAIDLSSGQKLYAAVVLIGCDVPPGVVVSTDGAGVQITPTKVTTAKIECFAPVTSVALVALDRA